MGLLRSLFKKKATAPRPVAAWVIPEPVPGGGGMRTILQNARAMADAGYDCRLYVCPAPGLHVVPHVVEERLLEWYGTSFPVHFETRLPDDVTCAIATAWNTAPFVSIQDVASKLYFVQDFEPDFLPMGDDRVRALQTYRSGLSIVTIGRWLAKAMEDVSGRPVPHTDFCADLSVYRDDGAGERERALCAIYQPEKPRRLSRLVEEALAVVHVLDPTIALYTFGSTRAPAVEGVEHLGMLSTEGCADLYRRCSAGLSVSATNPSRIPFEMMACGLPVVEAAGDNGSLDFPDDGVARVSPTPADLAAAIVGLMDDPERRASMGAAGRALMAGRPLSLEGHMFTEAVEGLLGHEGPEGVEGRDPLLARAKEVERERSRRSYEAMVASAMPLGAHRAEVAVPPEAVGDRGDVRAAIWSDNRQRDLRWVDGTADPAGGATIVLDFPERDDLTTWYIHVYAFPQEGEPLQLGALDPTVDSGPGATPGGARTYRLFDDGVEATLTPLN